MVKAQEWLDREYPKEGRENVKGLDISGKDLEGELDLRDFGNLEKLNCSQNKLTSLNIISCNKLIVLSCWSNNLTSLEVNNCLQLERLDCSNNNLTNCNFLTTLPNPEKLVILDLSNNNITQDLTAFSRFRNLEFLSISNNPFYGLLELLKNLTNLERLSIGNTNLSGNLVHLTQLGKLEWLDISNTDINSGVEYLPITLNSGGHRYKKISYSTDRRCNSKVWEIKEQLDLFTDEKLQEEWAGVGLIWKKVLNE